MPHLDPKRTQSVLSPSRNLPSHLPARKALVGGAFTTELLPVGGLFEQIHVNEEHSKNRVSSLDPSFNWAT